MNAIPQMIAIETIVQTNANQRIPLIGLSFLLGRECVSSLGKGIPNALTL
jgi:hypothetical protein